MVTKNSVVDRAENDAASDRVQADEFLEAADMEALHTLCCRMIDEREKLGKGFAAMIEGWSMLHGEQKEVSQPALDAIERVATQAIQFAREVIQSYSKPMVMYGQSGDKPKGML